jgi:ABC-2 type transport system ATP-binding protein
MSANDFAIQVNHLVKVFPSKKHRGIKAVDDISFQVKRGEIFGLLGPNGAGKTTIVKILTTILQPTSGSARVYGYDVKTDPLSVRKQIAVVLQETAVETLFSVRDNLLIFGYLHGLSGEVIAKRIEQVLDQFGLKEKSKEKAQDLSLGMRRRLQVAKVFMVDSPVLFLDEATTGMDPIIKRQTLDSIRKLAREGRTIVLTTQLLAEAEALCDNLIILNQGKTIASGNLETLRTLATRRFHVSVTFADASPEAFEAIRRLNPLSISISDRTVDMVFSGEETTILGHLQSISEKWRLDHFEVRGADLEEIFVELLGKDATEAQQ